MNVMTRLLIMLLLLAPLVAPAYAAAPLGEAVTTMTTQHHDMAADHACCDDSDQATAMAEHMSCDGSCSDCQHYCGATALALLPNFSSARALPEQRQWLPTLANLITRKDRLERPPMPANS
ncbi:hypothetical protein [Pseudidiomarina sp. CB1]|uniref:hypothetical protein n=1 Tax=Pseudidiomarina sp. CB1 TaxID=2972484 RepID=UPI0021632D41|nr:hypothetical protein [Pseudidiomarina sp. CB1]